MLPAIWHMEDLILSLSALSPRQLSFIVMCKSLTMRTEWRTLYANKIKGATWQHYLQRKQEKIYTD